MFELLLQTQLCKNGVIQNCTLCKDIKGAYAYHTEYASFCRCTDHTQLIYYIDNDETKGLACQDVETGKGAVDFKLVDSNCTEGTSWDDVYRKCRGCGFEVTSNNICRLPDALEILGPVIQCAFGYEQAYDENKKFYCRKCSNDTYSVLPSETSSAKVCMTCGENEFRDGGYCYNYTDEDCAKFAYNEEMTAGHYKNGTIDKTCRCSSGKIPIYSLKAKMHICADCKNDDIPTLFDGSRTLVSHLCRQVGKTILNTTCPDDAPLNETTGLCQCQMGYATAAAINAAGEELPNSVCVQVLTDSYHVRHCNKGALFYFYYKTAGSVFCAQTGNLVRDKDQNKGLTTGAIVGIVAGSVVLLALILMGVYFLVKRKRVPSSAGVARPTVDAGQTMI